MFNCEKNKTYIGQTGNYEKRMKQHFSGNGAKVTQKFKPKSSQVLNVVPGFLAKDIEHEYTKKYVKRKGYNNVRGGKWTNSKTFF